MKKQLIVFPLLVLFVALLAGCSKGYESQKNTAGLAITLNADRYPLIKGDNILSLKIADSSGKPVSDAKVNVRFYMPPMPGMAPMEYNIQPLAKGTVYSFPVNVAMEGGWKVEAVIAQPGKEPATVIFNLDAR